MLLIFIQQTSMLMTHLMPGRLGLDLRLASVVLFRDTPFLIGNSDSRLKIFMNLILDTIKETLAQNKLSPRYVQN